MTRYIPMDETEMEVHKRFVKSMDSVESAKSHALVRLSELEGRAKKKESAEALASATQELSILLRREANSDEADVCTMHNLIENGVLCLSDPTLTAWENIHQLQKTFWQMLASFANDGSMLFERRKSLLLDSVLNPDHLARAVSSHSKGKGGSEWLRNEGRSAWLPNRHPTRMRRSCEFVMLFFHTMDLLGARVLECLEGKRETQRPPSPPQLDSKSDVTKPAGRAIRQAVRESPTSAPVQSIRRIRLAPNQSIREQYSFVPLSARHQAEIPEYNPDAPIADRGDELLVINHVPAKRHPAFRHLDAKPPVIKGATAGRILKRESTRTPPPVPTIQKRHTTISPVKQLKQLAELTNQQWRGHQQTGHHHKATARAAPVSSAATVSKGISTSAPTTATSAPSNLWCHETL